MPLARGPGLSTPVEIPSEGVVTELDPSAYLPAWITPPDRNGNTVEIPMNPPREQWFTLKDIAGLGVVPVDIVTTANPDGGVSVDLVRVKERAIVWPMRVRGRTNTEFLDKWRYLGNALAKTRRFGPGKLRLYRPDGTAREIEAYYQDGWGNEPHDGAWLEDTCPVSLLCPDPFWRDTEATVLEREYGTLVDYLDPYPNIGTGQVLGATTLLNAGQADVWPDWTITGPLTSLTAANTTRSQSFVLTYTLTAGQAITMSSRPIQVRGPAGQNLTSALNLPTGKPWRLDSEWSSNVTFTAAGAGAGSKISLRFFAGHELA